MRLRFMFHYCIPLERQPTSSAIHEKLGGTGIIEELVFKIKGMNWWPRARQIERALGVENRSFPPWPLRLGQ